MLNKVILQGNLVANCETRHTTSTSVTTTRLASNENYRDKNGESHQSTTFVDIELWDRAGETFAQYHKKGDQAIVEGRLKLDTWQDKATGTQRSRLKINVQQFHFVGNKTNRQNRQGQGGGGTNGGPPPDDVPPSD